MSDETTTKVKMCPHGAEAGLYSATPGGASYCGQCANEVLHKLVQCHVLGHDAGDDPTSFYLTAVSADETPTDACLFRCIRCGVLF